MRPAMEELLRRSLAGGVLIFAVVLLRRLFRGRVPANTWPVLWGVCLFRLLSPVTAASPLSLYALFRKPAPAVSRISLVPGYGPVRPAPPLWEPAAAALWGLAALLLAFWLLTAWLRLYHQVSALPLAARGDHRLTSLPGRARLRLGELPQAPLTFGVLRPCVVVSPCLMGTELELVLAHEGAHIRRWDNLWSLALFPALCLHWFNPAVWLMVRLLKQDLELCCDAAVLRQIGDARRADYANALINAAASGGTSPFWCAGFGQTSAEERILNIMTFKRTGAVSLLLAMSIVAMTTTALATEPSKATPLNDIHVAAEAGVAATVCLTRANDAGEMELSMDGGATWVPYAASPEPAPELTAYTPETYAAQLESARQALPQMVAEGKLTQAEADQLLADMEADLKALEKGEISIFYGEETDTAGNLLNYTVSIIGADGSLSHASNESDIVLNVTAG